MTPVWKFGPPIDRLERGMPSRRQQVFADDLPVGEIEIHLHRRGGPDHLADLSYGITAIAYGPLTPVQDLTRPWSPSPPP